MSDRIEKETVDSEVLICLEEKGLEVVKFDWRKHISEELQNGKYWQLKIRYRKSITVTLVFYFSLYAKHI